MKYSISMKWSDEDEGFIAVVNELSGLSAFGETQEEAVAELKVAAEAYLEVLRDSGGVIPAPEKLVPFSGQLRVRMPKSLHARLVAEAENEGVSLNTYIVSLLSKRRAERQARALNQGPAQKSSLSVGADGVAEKPSQKCNVRRVERNRSRKK